jgi:hypothetical protein
MFKLGFVTSLETSLKQVQLGGEERLEEGSCERVNGCQGLCTCKTMLALSGTRQVMRKQAFSQWGFRKKPYCPKLQQYISV